MTAQGKTDAVDLALTSYLEVSGDSGPPGRAAVRDLRHSPYNSPRAAEMKILGGSDREEGGGGWWAIQTVRDTS